MQSHVYKGHDPIAISYNCRVILNGIVTSITLCCYRDGVTYQIVLLAVSVLCSLCGFLHLALLLC